MIRIKTILILFLSIIFVSTINAQQPAKTLPFTAEQDADGARFVWFVLNETGFPRPYEPCKDIPKSQYYREVSEPRTGDIAWWPSFMATYDSRQPPDSNILAARGFLSLKELESKLGPAKFFRIQVKRDESPKGETP